jgi:nucleotide-binding universal stress UspA family protein
MPKGERRVPHNSRDGHAPRVLAAVDGSLVTGPVLEEARLLAHRVGARAEALCVGPCPTEARANAERLRMTMMTVDGDPGRRIVEAANAPDVVLVVIGARRSPTEQGAMGHVARHLVRRLPVAVVVVPPDFQPRSLRHVLVPLDGQRATGRAVAWVVELIAPSSRVAVFHTFTPETMPTMLDHSEDVELWQEEFVERCCPELTRFAARGARFAAGDPAAKVSQALHTEPVELVVMAWRQRLKRGHGRVVLDALKHSTVPVLLLPMTPKQLDSRI